MTSKSHITMLLQSARDGDNDAASAVLPLVYEELRSIAAARMRRLPPGQTLQPTALVHDAYLRILGKDDGFENRRHFFFVAARAMHDILVEDARRKGTAKRGGDRKRVSDEALVLAIDTPSENMIELSEVLETFEKKYPRKHQLVLLRFFAGLSEAQAADILEVDERTARRDWRFARAWLREQLGGAEDGSDGDA